jgi:hypothetical protein
MNRIVWLIGGAALAVSAGASASADAIFRGFDNNTGGGVPMASTPNADAARADFLSALTSPVSNDLEALANGGGPAVVSFGESLTMTATGAQFQVRDTALNAAHGTQGPRFLYVEPGESVVGLTLVFSSAIQALGFTFTDASDWFNSGQNPPQLLVTVGDAPGVSLITGLNTNEIRDGSTGFFGFVADSPFTTVTIFRPIGGGDTDAIGFDGFIVPTPGAAALVGLAGLVVVRRKR